MINENKSKLVTGVAGVHFTMLHLEILKNIYQLVAENLKKARQRSSHPTHPQSHKIQPEDSVLIKGSYSWSISTIL